MNGQVFGVLEEPYQIAVSGIQQKKFAALC